MQIGDLTSSPAKLFKAWENVRVHWEETKLHWNDSVSQQFEEKYLSAFEFELQATLERMRTLAAVFNAAEQEANR